ncbi:hypothetical protein COCMIDRAFT_109138 [Bipolaris oryzae ATCC 44560]|uniref:DUF7703 domain-containing protein n=1 Tax=Bipolaris oryzae ATCC 44560 TaxID=930090 RepID=W6YRR5_COCMI|nr:uncharacterized protein COCMIDRAFT_109138 [Bipolaris oryzae ATCC 44560]EUC40315.1 hypothetical protein COCMIDRAFT_109138 [Bipolaris oryzae ATCC 44560]
MANVTTPGNGITGANFDIYGANRVLPRAMTAFTAIAWYNSLELLVLIFCIFKKYSGLYFWSLIINALSAWMKQNNVGHNADLYNVLLTVGWILMVPGQSMVLYSRLHLISPNSNLLRIIFWTIILSAICLCVPTVTLNLRQYTTKSPTVYTRGYSIMEKIQMVLFTLQEIFISCVYLCETRKLMLVIFDGKTRKWMWQLVAMNLLLVFLDATLLTMEFLNLYMIQTTFKSLLYSFKLKIEFGVLSQIVRIIQRSSRDATPELGIQTDVEAQKEKKVGVVSEVEVLQHNVPPEWRLSRGATAKVSPIALNAPSRCFLESDASSVASIDLMYPGRLG